jgi:hypothetical protein
MLCLVNVDTFTGFEIRKVVLMITAIWCIGTPISEKHSGNHVSDYTASQHRRLQYLRFLSENTKYLQYIVKP